MEKSQHQPVSFSRLFKYPVFRVYFIFSIVVLLFLGALLYMGMPDDKQLKSALKGKDAEINELQEEIEVLEILNAADEQLIVSGDYDQAIAQYNQLRQNTRNEKLQNLLSVRTQNADSLKNYFKNNRGQSQQKDYRLAKQEEKITVLKERLDSLKEVKSTIAENYGDTLSELRQEAMVLRQKLNQKEKVKVLQFKSSNGQTVHYLGEVEDGKANGGGVGIWTTGSIYKGDWKDNRRHGKGTIESQNGERYEGDWTKGVREGEGEYFWPSGERYDGEWKENKRHGQGTLYDRDNNVQYEGKWKNDKPVKS